MVTDEDPGNSSTENVTRRISFAKYNVNIYIIFVTLVEHLDTYYAVYYLSRSTILLRKM